MKKSLLIPIIILSFIQADVYAFVPKKMTVEHFTNTLCSVCASRNPGFKSNLNNETNYTLLTIHPSSPYSACKLNQVDKRGNDGRTKFYGIYGSTPRLSINGSIISSSSNYSLATLFAPFREDSSSFSISIQQLKKGNESIKFRVVIKTVDTHQLTQGRMYFAIAEKGLQYNAPNGETLHENVLRKSVTDSTGSLVNLSKNVGDSVVLNFEWALSNGILNNNLIGVAILQDNNKTLLQSASTAPGDQDFRLGINSISKLNSIKIYPNPSKDYIQFETTGIEDLSNYTIIDIRGRIVQTGEFKTIVDIKELETGIYYVIIEGQRQRYRAVLKKD